MLPQKEHQSISADAKNERQPVSTGAKNPTPMPTSPSPYRPHNPDHEILLIIFYPKSVIRVYDRLVFIPSRLVISLAKS